MQLLDCIKSPKTVLYRECPKHFKWFLKTENICVNINCGAEVIVKLIMI